MSVIQSQENELRYLKVENLEQEAQMIGNYYRDLIRSYGVDCIFQHLDTSEFENFNNIVDRNAILKNAYGYNLTPDYSISSHMISYMEIEGDIFNLDKFTVRSNTDVNFYFDAIDFACELAPKLGQYKEFKIKSFQLTCEVPLRSYFKNHPKYKLDLTNGQNEYSCDILEGKMKVVIDDYEEYEKLHTVECDAYEHSEPCVSFPSNAQLYRSLEHVLKDDKFLDTKIFLDYKVHKITDKCGNERALLAGTVYGSVLFFDIHSIGKYIELIHPNVGDLVTIDFPDQKDREKYEITECYDKQLAQDGINPLLHKYVWKCKARRFVSCNDVEEDNEASDRMKEKQDFAIVNAEQVQRAVSLYEDNEDLIAYGGHSGIVDTYDKQKIEAPENQPNLEYACLDKDEAIDIMNFSTGAKLVTNAFDLFFLTSTGNAIKLTTVQLETEPLAKFESNQKWLKATNDKILFNNIEGNVYTIASSQKIQNKDFQTCLESLYERTFDNDYINRNSESFFKFKNTRTYLYATSDSLYVKFQNDDELYKLA